MKHWNFLFKILLKLFRFENVSKVEVKMLIHAMSFSEYRDRGKDFLIFKVQEYF